MCVCGYSYAVHYAVRQRTVQLRACVCGAFVGVYTSNVRADILSMYQTIVCAPTLRAGDAASYALPYTNTSTAREWAKVYYRRGPQQHFKLAGGVNVVPARFMDALVRTNAHNACVTVYVDIMHRERAGAPVLMQYAIMLAQFTARSRSHTHAHTRSEHAITCRCVCVCVVQLIKTAHA